MDFLDNLIGAISSGAGAEAGKAVSKIADQAEVIMQDISDTIPVVKYGSIALALATVGCLIYNYKQTSLLKELVKKNGK